MSAESGASAAVPTHRARPRDAVALGAGLDRAVEPDSACGAGTQVTCAAARTVDGTSHLLDTPARAQVEDVQRLQAGDRARDDLAFRANDQIVRSIEQRLDRDCARKRTRPPPMKLWAPCLNPSAPD
jgi:hypothetical protein